MAGSTVKVRKPPADDFEGLAAFFAEEASAMGVDAPLFALQANTYARLAELQMRRAAPPQTEDCAA